MNIMIVEIGHAKAIDVSSSNVGVRFVMHMSMGEDVELNEDVQNAKFSLCTPMFKYAINISFWSSPWISTRFRRKRVEGGFSGQ